MPVYKRRPGERASVHPLHSAVDTSDLVGTIAAGLHGSDQALADLVFYQDHRMREGS